MSAITNTFIIIRIKNQKIFLVYIETFNYFKRYNSLDKCELRDDFLYY